VYPRKHPYLVWYHFESLSDIESNSPPQPIIVDVGCGEGLLLSEMRNDYTRIGVDISKTCLRHVIANGSVESCVLSVAERFPFQSNVVDVVVSHQSLEHIVDQAKVISEVSRVLKPNGLFIATTPVSGPLGRLAARSRNAKGQRVLSPDHVSEYESQEHIVDSFLRQSDGTLSLIKVKKKSVRVPLSRVFPWLYDRGYLGPMLPALFYYSDVYVVFQKNNTASLNSAQMEYESTS
jgi:SAM-dependent methyltransferase